MKLLCLQFVAKIKASWNLFYELYSDKVIRLVHKFIDQNVYV